ncbi:type I 3-dehydroquinate dehydratase [Oceanobacillus chungangensis]|uniref:3-dehydroquinate dehydratase n=1 Tax=Oceanobacillus chungangensis TaxID=1229152 RepID=A0A3D8PLV3_9BACI|nr:type I 3-dehydroquinate dehydratase [Oceanobacillus chungangensis]RDW16219.1 type I 3-dehydroquinate dehydratase [Oceanobacillus chungangensis]
MNNTLTVKGITIGEGAPKICVPMVGTTIEQLIKEAELLTTLDLDIVEWRVDFFESVEDVDKVKEALTKIRERLIDIPLIFTFRSAKEGGEMEVSMDYYVALNKAALESGNVEFIDVELFSGEQIVIQLVELAHQQGTRVIISNHDFEKTPPKKEIINRLLKAQDFGADIPKIAVMPNNVQDVITLLDATNEIRTHYADRPIITMSMAGQGVVSRLAGEIFGSAITFGAATKASAPGQVGVQELREVLDLIHNNFQPSQGEIK